MMRDVLLARIAASPWARVPRALVNAAAGSQPRVVRVRSGAARGSRLELDLRREKAYWIGHYEPIVQAFLSKHLATGDVFWDVGVHVGFFSVCAARRGARVLAVEASPDNARRALRNFELNQVDGTMVEAAAWDSDGGAALVAGSSSSEWRVCPGAGLRTVTLDGLALEHAPPTVIKLDVEGAEARALRGAQRVLREARPIVICELHGAVTRAEVEALLAEYRTQTLGGDSRIVAFPEESPAGTASIAR
jgi:FkbM family methyltransferase